MIAIRSRKLTQVIPFGTFPFRTTRNPIFEIPANHSRDRHLSRDKVRHSLRSSLRFSRKSFGLRCRRYHNEGAGKSPRKLVPANFERHCPTGDSSGRTEAVIDKFRADCEVGDCQHAYALSFAPATGEKDHRRSFPIRDGFGTESNPNRPSRTDFTKTSRITFGNIRHDETRFRTMA